MKEKMPLGIAIVIVAVFIALVVLGIMYQSRTSQSLISNFDECVAAGNPVMESYPEQCMTRDGRNFVNEKQVVVPPHSISMCYRYFAQTNRGSFDQALLRMEIMGDQVAGEYQNIPAEKDSKKGTFTGTVGAMDPMISARTADVWWDSFAEGMRVTEQLHILFGEGSASAMFGEMIDRGDGVYVYRDVSKLTPGFQMSQIDCESLDDIGLVEQYIRAHIAEIAPQQAVLGGTWYVTTIFVNPSTETGSVSYEDGHIMGSANFSYTRNGDQIVITAIHKK